MKPLVVALALFPLLACSKAHTDLEAAFGVEKIPESPSLEARDVAITSQRHRGVTSYRGVARVHLSDDFIGIEISLPFLKALSIPADDVVACGMTCFGTGDQHVDLLIPKTGTELRIPSSSALLHWCWRNKKPMLPHAAKSDWLYKRMPLPDASEFQSQLASLEVFNEQVTQSCLGY